MRAGQDRWHRLLLASPSRSSTTSLTAPLDSFVCAMTADQRFPSNSSDRVVQRSVSIKLKLIQMLFPLSLINSLPPLTAMLGLALTAIVMPALVPCVVDAMWESKAAVKTLVETVAPALQADSSDFKLRRFPKFIEQVVELHRLGRRGALLINCLNRRPDGHRRSSGH